MAQKCFSKQRNGMVVNRFDMVWICTVLLGEVMDVHGRETIGKGEVKLGEV